MRKETRLTPAAIMLAYCMSMPVMSIADDGAPGYTEESVVAPTIIDLNETDIDVAQNNALSTQIYELKQQVEKLGKENLLEKVNAMRAEIQYLRGIVDVQAHDLKLLQKNLQQPQLQAVAPTASATEAMPATKDRDYTKAQEQFNAFVQSFPSGEYTANAYYWLGEIYLLKGQYTAAESNLQQVIVHDGPHNKTPDAMLKLAMVYVNTQNMAKAKAMVEKLKAQYPDSAATRMAKIQLGSLSS